MKRGAEDVEDKKRKKGSRRVEIVGGGTAVRMQVITHILRRW